MLQQDRMRQTIQQMSKHSTNQVCILKGGRGQAGGGREARPRPAVELTAGFFVSQEFFSVRPQDRDDVLAVSIFLANL